MTLERLISIARGETLADLLLTNARIVNTFSGEVEEGNIAICGDRIAGIGDYQRGKEVVDLGRRYVAPALIDGHVHPESSMLHIARYAEAVVPHGVCAIVTDFHEIANVKGLKGIQYMLRSARDLPLDIYYMVASCVPATGLETAGAVLTAKDVETALTWPNTKGLGEMMNFPGVLAADRDVLAKIASAKGRVVDGHAPGLSGKNLNAYIASGIRSDHECTALDEAAEKLRRGMHVMIREGSSEKNLETLLPLVTDKTCGRCLFVVDDRSCADLMRDGDMDAVVRKAIRLGLDPIRAIQLATINTASYFRLDGLGAIAPGHFANFIIFKDLASFQVEDVFHHGRPVAKNGRALFSPSVLEDSEMMHSVNIKPFSVEDLRMPAADGVLPVIELVPDQIVTRKKELRPKVENGFTVPDTGRDILKLVVVERHRASGNIGLGLVTGFGLKRGALASSIAHDSHNIVAVGTNDKDIYVAIKEIERLQGGLVIAADGSVRGSLALPVAGLLSTDPLETVVRRHEDLKRMAAEIGARPPDPFAILAFLALPVIPELRLTDLGLVDVLAFKIIR